MWQVPNHATVSPCKVVLVVHSIVHLSSLISILWKIQDPCQLVNLLTTVWFSAVSCMQLQQATFSFSHAMNQKIVSLFSTTRATLQVQCLCYNYKNKSYIQLELCCGFNYFKPKIIVKCVSMLFDRFSSLLRSFKRFSVFVFLSSEHNFLSVHHVLCLANFSEFIIALVWFNWLMSWFHAFWKELWFIQLSWFKKTQILQCNFALWFKSLYSEVLSGRLISLVLKPKSSLSQNPNFFPLSLFLHYVFTSNCQICLGMLVYVWFSVSFGLSRPTTNVSALSISRLT